MTPETNEDKRAEICRKFHEAVSTATHPSSTAFYGLMADCAALHAKKQQDYGSKDDPFANVSASEELGIPAWKGAVVRMCDKVKRIKKYCVDGNLANESVDDSFLDLAVYALIALVLLQEKR